MTQPTYEPATTGLVLIDLLNDFLADDGKMNAPLRPMLEQRDTLAKLGRLLAGAREAGVKVFYSPHGLDEHSFDDVKAVHPRFEAGISQKLFWKGSHGAEFYPALAPRQGETVLTRHRMYDSFVGTDLSAQLEAQGIEKVVLAGLTSQTCVEGTGRHALENGYHVTFIADAVADFSEEAHQAATELAYPVFGHEVLEVDAFLTAVADPARTGRH